MGNVNTALLVIDMQSGLFEKGVYNAEDLLTKTVSLIAQAHGADIPVIYVQHSGSSERHPLYPDKPGWALHPSLQPQPDEPIIHKKAPDSFKQTSLKQELQGRKIRNLIVMGLQTEVCINATCRRAVELGYDVTLAADAHSTFDKKTVSAESIIAEHNAALGAIHVHLKPTAEITFE